MFDRVLNKPLNPSRLEDLKVALLKQDNRKAN